ncbi:MAG: hypothetical protein RBR71_10985 [Gudongella sp.]|nr:hypothetical protein [Gudongella sp.]
MIEYLPSIVLFGSIAILLLLGALMIGLYFMIKKLMFYNASLKNQNRDDKDD